MIKDYCSVSPDKIGNIYIGRACSTHDKDYWNNDRYVSGGRKIKADLKLGFNIFWTGFKYFISSILVMLASPIYMIAVLLFGSLGRKIFHWYKSNVEFK